VPLPNLFVIGAPKCGTTSLHQYLNQHPKISMSEVKEPKFFLGEGLPPEHHGPGDERACAAYVYDRSAYEALFRYPDGPGTYAGESTPFYLWHPDAPGRIHQTVPDARLVAVLREPTTRAYSNWADLRAQGREKLSFDDGMAAEGDRARQGWEPFWFYRSLGLYGAQLTRLFEVFPRTSVKVVLAEDLEDAPGPIVDEILRFLALEPMAEPLVTSRLNQTMYEPVDRSSRLVDALFRRGERARPVVPPVVRKYARAIVQRRLRARANSKANAPELQRRFSGSFAADRHDLEALGIDITRWDQ
jgi:hypothetical protein